jgi:hypothetical protein
VVGGTIFSKDEIISVAVVVGAYPMDREDCSIVPVGEAASVGEDN